MIFKRKRAAVALLLSGSLIVGILSSCAATVPGASFGGLVPDEEMTVYNPATSSQVEQPDSTPSSDVPQPAFDNLYDDVGEVIEDESGTVEISDVDVPMDANLILRPTPLGTLVKANSKATIDYSSTSDGYVMVCYTADTTQRLKAQVTTPVGTTYTYDINLQEWTAFPLSEGNGTYKVTVFENTNGTKYATVVSASFDVALANEFAPFIRPNQYVDYADAMNTIAKASELVSTSTDSLEQIEAIYDWVITNMTYDRELASSVQSGYLPDIDAVYNSKTGICFDYAALMCAMLRSQFIPCKLIVGYAGSAYHAWINVYTEETGWIEGSILFNGETWERMDPTFASTGKGSEKIMEYIGDGKNYVAMYAY